MKKIYWLQGQDLLKTIPLQGGFEVMHRTRNRRSLCLIFVNLHYRIPKANTL